MSGGEAFLRHRCYNLPERSEPQRSVARSQFDERYDLLLQGSGRQCVGDVAAFDGDQYQRNGQRKPKLGGAPSFVNLGPATNEATRELGRAVLTATFYVIWRYATGSPVINPVPVAVVPSNTGKYRPIRLPQTSTYRQTNTRTGYKRATPSCTAGTLFFGYLQAAVVAEPTSGVIMPKYQILSVMYAPPGLAASIPRRTQTATYLVRAQRSVSLTCVSGTP